MSKQTNSEQLDAVLEAYMMSVPEPNHDTLIEWIRRYPAFAEELTEFTVARLTEPFETEQDDTIDEAAFQRDLEVAQRVLKRLHPQQPLTSLLDAGQAVGLTTIMVIAERVNLSKALVRKLDLRLIDAASLPAQLVTQLAQVFQVSSDTLWQYLQGQPRLTAGSFKSEQAPAVVEPEDFFEAVRQDVSLTEEQRQHWLSLKP